MSIEGKDGPTWLGDMRRSAWEAYHDLPLPERAVHLWRYTDPKFFLPDGDPFRKSKELDAAELSPWCEVCEKELSGGISSLGISVDGWTHKVSLPAELSDRGMILKKLGQAVREDQDLVAPYFGQIVPGEGGKFEALNLAAWSGGLFLYLPKDVVVEAPVHLFINDSGETPFFAQRVLVVMEEGSAMTLFTEFSSLSPNGRTGRQVSAVIEVIQKESSHLQHVTVQRLSQSINNYLTSRVHLETGARLLSVVTAFGGGTTKVDTGAVLTGEGAESELFGFAFGEARQHLDHHTVYDHRAPHTRSNLDFKVVLKGHARSIFTGLLRIADKAPYCEAYQENRNILLSDECRADTIPELEILTDEVRCSHGATVGPLDPEHLFYLMSRGIPREESLRMAVGGFLEPTLVKIPGALQARVRRCVDERLKEF